MKLIVNPHKIEIERTPVNEKEINVTEIEFEFAEEITDDYVKEAYFTLNGNSYKQIISNNKCNIPYEVLTQKGQLEIGVVAYLVENEEEIKRYNPSPTFIMTWAGSLKDNAENSVPITPTDKEQIEQQITDLQKGISGDNYYDEVNYQKIRYQSTDVYITTIPKYDNDNNLINVYIADGVNKSPLKYAQDNYTTLTINASLWIKNSITGEGANPSIIGNGQILRENDMLGEGIADNLLYIGIKEDRSFSEYKVNETTAQQMLSDGCKQVFDVYWKLIENGEALDLTGIYSNEGNEATSTKSPRQCMGIKADGTIIIITCDGRTNESRGLYQTDLQELLIEYGCTDGWNLDGGGSTSTIIKGSKLNKNIDDNGTTDRFIRYTLNVKKETKNEEIAKAYSKIGEEKQNLIQQIIPYLNSEIANQRVLCCFIPASTENNVISTSSVYTPIYFANTKYAPDIMAQHFTLEKQNDGDTYPCIIKCDKTGYKLFKANITLRSGTSGKKYLAIYSNNSRIERSIRTFSVENNGEDKLLTFDINTIINNTIAGTGYQLMIYGSANDAIVHGCFEIEYLE